MSAMQIPTEQVGVVLDEIVEELLSAAGIAGPPVAAFDVAATLGLSVLLDGRLANRARFARIRGDRGQIFLRPEERPERLHWAAAHEIGESLVEGIAAALCAAPSDLTPPERERIANEFANRLMLPTDWFAAAGDAAQWDLLLLKDRFSTASHELIARRMLAFAPASIVTVFDQDRVTFRRGFGGRSAPRCRPLETAAQQRAHVGADVAEHQDEAIRVRAWPVHEPHWRREILRTEAVAA